jgi:hypothetical protein
VALGQQLRARRRVEVVQEVRQQDHVVAGAEIDVERAAGNRTEPIGHAELRGRLLRDFQDLRPIRANDLRAGVAPREGKAPQAVARGDVEHLDRLARVGIDELRDQFRRHEHERRHRAGEVDPDGVIRRGRALTRRCRATLADGVGEAIEAGEQLVAVHELHRPAHIRRRLAVEKDGRVLGQPVRAAAVLNEQADDREKVAQDAHAALGGAGCFRDRRGSSLAATDGGKHVQLNRRPQRGRALVAVERLEDQCR